MANEAGQASSQFSDVALMEFIAEKKTWALGTLYDRFAARLNGLALQILRDRHLAEDVLQELFIHVWEKADKFDPSKGTPAGWLMILCRNLSIDKLRSRVRREKRTSEFKNEESASPEKHLDENILQKEVFDILEYLPMEQSIPIAMAFFQGMTQREISDKLGVPLGTIKTRIRLGLRKIRTMMDSNEP